MLSKHSRQCPNGIGSFEAWSVGLATSRHPLHTGAPSGLPVNPNIRCTKWCALRPMASCRSIKPLQMSVGLGLFCATLALIGILYALILRVFTNIWVEGWTALMIAVLFLGGIQLISVGVLGEYVGRIYSEVKKRPLYVVKEYIGFENGPAMSRSPIIHSK
jgi:hypothetical protein